MRAYWSRDAMPAGAAASERSIAATSARASSSVSSTATRAAGPWAGCVEVDVHRVRVRRVHGMVDVDGGAGEPEPALAPLPLPSTLDRLGLVGAHWVLAAPGSRPKKVEDLAPTRRRPPRAGTRAGRPRRTRARRPS